MYKLNLNLSNIEQTVQPGPGLITLHLCLAQAQPLSQHLLCLKVLPQPLSPHLICLKVLVHPPHKLEILKVKTSINTQKYLFENLVYLDQKNHRQ